MGYIAGKSSLRTVRPGDSNWLLKDTVIVAPRAGFEIKNECPRSYASVIMECMERGWLTPVATVRDTELFWEEFSK